MLNLGDRRKHSTPHRSNKYQTGLSQLLSCELSNLKFIHESTNAELGVSAPHHPASLGIPIRHGDTKPSSADTPKAPGHYSVEIERLVARRLSG